MRFEHVTYDQVAVVQQKHLKEKFTELEKMILVTLNDGRCRALALTKLEECYMWVGKAIRDEQLDRTVPPWKAT